MLFMREASIMAETIDETQLLQAKTRRTAVLQLAEEHGLLTAKDRQIGGRFSADLVERAKQVTGIASDTELLTYALAKVALEDDFGQRLVARRGRVPAGTFFAG
jgi:hypothetical protein